jgi:hypothetical protein
MGLFVLVAFQHILHPAEMVAKEEARILLGAV